MFRAIGRWFKAIGYLLTGQINSARRTLDTNPQVVRSKFEEIVRDKTGRIHQYKQAVASLIAQQEKKLAKVKMLTEEVQKLIRLKDGALAKAKQRVAALTKQGTDKAKIQLDEDYRKCLTAFNDFSATLDEKKGHISDLEGDIGEYGKRIADHKIQLEGLLRELEKVKGEAADTVADMITAQQEKELADTLSGIAQDGSAEELQSMRELRREVKAEARVSKELAGMDTAAQEAEFLEYARQGAHNDEFEALVGLAEQADAPPATEAPGEAESASKLPE